MKWLPFTVAGVRPPARMGHVAVAVDSQAWADELVLLHGGLGNDRAALADLYLLSSNSWSHPQTSGPAPPARAFHAGASIGCKLYIFGGHVWVREKKGLLKFGGEGLWCLDTDTWQWSQLPPQRDQPAPVARDFCCMVALEGERLLLHGGLDHSEKRLDDTWIYHAPSGTWTEIRVAGQRPKARYGHCMCRIDSRILMFGGETGGGLTRDLWTLRGAGAGEEAPAWIPLELPGPAPAPRKGHACANVGLWLVVMGGRTAEIGWFRSKTELFHNDVVVMEREGTVQWRTPGVGRDKPAPREFHSLTSLAGGKLLLFGGGSGKAIHGDAWMLDTEDEAAINPSLSDQSLLSQLAAIQVRQAGSGQPQVPALEGLGTPRMALQDGQGQLDAVTQQHHSWPGEGQEPAWPHAAEADGQQPLGGASMLEEWSRRSTRAGMVASNSAALAQLRQRLGLPEQGPAELSGEAPSQLYEEGGPPEERQVALDAEQCDALADADVQDIHLGDIPGLLSSYKALCRKAATLKSTGHGRFCHLESCQLSLSDVQLLHNEYRNLTLHQLKAG